MKAKIQERKEIAKGTMQVMYDLLGSEVSFKAGQHMTITIPKLLYPDERGNRRMFSIASSPNQKGSLSMATRIGISGFKKTLYEAHLGTEVEIDTISGLFTLPENTSRPLIFIAGGIGITPFMSMLMFVYDQKTQPTITLLYSNKNKKSSAFFDELQRMEQENPKFKFIPIMTQDENWTGEKRHINAVFLREYFSDAGAYDFYIAGPLAMTDAISKEISEAGITSDHIKRENFTGY